MKLLQICAAIALVTSSSSLMADPSLNSYSVTMKIEHGGTILAEPRMLVKAGENSKIVLQKPDGTAFSMDFSAAPTSNNAIAFNSAINFTAAAGYSYSLNPKMLVTNGEQGKIVYGSDDGLTVHPISVSFVVSDR
ncbi:hypothetical protein ACFOWX_05525 [Sphingorhabdus arenilitoris]|uniref:Uncharacterized protein n=1 Tax=Sphingorhabdus arenilitoris TaxID=1490041 RepID=A0ABV8RI13_9SPHN